MFNISKHLLSHFDRFFTILTFSILTFDLQREQETNLKLKKFPKHPQTAIGTAKYVNT